MRYGSILASFAAASIAILAYHLLVATSAGGSAEPPRDPLHAQDGAQASPVLRGAAGGDLPRRLAALEVRLAALERRLDGGAASRPGLDPSPASHPGAAPAPTERREEDLAVYRERIRQLDAEGRVAPQDRERAAVLLAEHAQAVRLVRLGAGERDAIEAQVRDLAEQLASDLAGVLPPDMARDVTSAPPLASSAPVR